MTLRCCATPLHLLLAANIELQQLYQHCRSCQSRHKLSKTLLRFRDVCCGPHKQLNDVLYQFVVMLCCVNWQVRRPNLLPRPELNYPDCRLTVPTSCNSQPRARLHWMCFQVLPRERQIKFHSKFVCSSSRPSLMWGNSEHLRHSTLEVCKVPAERMQDPGSNWDLLECL